MDEKHDGSTALKKKKARDVDMTQGSITRHLIRFALPLLVGNLFQQLYNTVDTWVVGNYVSNEAFSAVGSVGPIINLLIGFFTGLASGAGVVISQYYGAKREEDVHDTVHTAVVMTLILGVVFTILGLTVTPFMLRAMNTPDNVFPQSSAYLRIYFSGIITVMLYNIGSGILRAVGDSTRPFYFLVVCAVLNTILDFFFVLALDMGVEGVALATIISQGVSALLVLITLMRAKSWIRLDLRDLRINRRMLKKIIHVGFPAALQMSLTSFSNIFVQSYINFFGDNCMAGWTAYNKVDQILMLPIQSIALASTTFVGQNLGRDQVERAKTGVHRAMQIAFVTTVILMIPIMLFSPSIVAFFNPKPEVIDYGTLMLHWMTPFYLLTLVNQIYSGALRGAGNSRAPMIIMLFSFVVFRQIYLFIVSRFWNQIIPIAMSYPAGWLLCSILIMIYYRKVHLNDIRLVDDLPKKN